MSLDQQANIPIRKITSMGQCGKAVTSLLTHWSYVFLALAHRLRKASEKFWPVDLGVNELLLPESIDPFHKSHNAPVPYPTIHHFVAEMCTFLLQKGALWDICLMHCGICEMGLCWLITGCCEMPGAILFGQQANHIFINTCDIYVLRRHAKCQYVLCVWHNTW